MVHTATAVFMRQPKDESIAIRPSVEGTRNILDACVLYKDQIKKIVITSSIKCTHFQKEEKKGKVKHYDHNDFSDPNLGTAYSKGKTRAEILAWDYAKKYDLNITTILPTLILGPYITNKKTPTMDFIKKMF